MKSRLIQSWKPASVVKEAELSHPAMLRSLMFLAIPIPVAKTMSVFPISLFSAATVEPTVNGAGGLTSLISPTLTTPLLSL